MSWFKDFLGGVGAAATTALSATGPAGAIISAGINAFLDDDEKVTAETTTEEFEAKLNSLTPEQQEKVAKAYYGYLSDKEKYAFETIQSNNNKETEMLRIKELADGGDNAVRPKAVMLCVWTVVAIGFSYSVLLLGLPFFATFGDLPADVVKELLPEWEQLAGPLALPSWVIRCYFTDRSSDKANKLNASNGLEATGKESFITKTVKAWKKR